ncbi:hypothetical protein GCM10022226_77830 [Sphaerisporangium flaviroseum]|uniref:Uncharacterized protein n=1 Tax=Sphaerisporangium flaviroseum TaxID=509199 RepID=A0ABP7JF00_9ACTN
MKLSPTARRLCTAVVFAAARGAAAAAGSALVGLALWWFTQR